MWQAIVSAEDLLNGCYPLLNMQVSNVPGNFFYHQGMINIVSNSECEGNVLHMSYVNKEVPGNYL
jgi:hypothetical protein